MTNISRGLNRLIAVALIDPKFKFLLLTCPKIAVEQDYNAESLELTQIEKEAVLSVETDSLTGLAVQLCNLSDKIGQPS